MTDGSFPNGQMRRHMTDGSFPNGQMRRHMTDGSLRNGQIHASPDAYAPSRWMS